MVAGPPGHGQPAEGAVSNTMSGTAGIVVQARDVHGGVHVHAPPPRVQPALRQLPADTALFTGRDGELDRLLVLAGQAGAGGSPGTVVISAIDGMGGIGHLATGETARGTEHLRQALQVYQRLGMRPDIERVTARLVGLAPE